MQAPAPATRPPGTRSGPARLTAAHFSLSRWVSGSQAVLSNDIRSHFTLPLVIITPSASVIHIWSQLKTHHNLSISAPRQLCTLVFQGSHPGYPGPGQGLMAKPRRPSAPLRGQASPAKLTGGEVSRAEQTRTASASPASLYPGPGPDYMRMDAMLGGSEVRPSPAKVRTASLEGSESDNSVRSLRSESDPGLADTPGQVAAISSTDPTPDTISGLAEAFKPPSAELGASGGHGSPGALSLSGHGSHGGHQADTQVMMLCL